MPAYQYDGALDEPLPKELLKADIDLARHINHRVGGPPKLPPVQPVRVARKAAEDVVEFVGY